MGIVKLMDREDMLERLEETNDPIGVTLEKWTLLMLWHRENGDIDPGRGYYDVVTCALCEDNASLGRVICFDCLMTEYDKPCNYSGSTWKNYNSKPSLENARAMVELIERIKIGEEH